VACRVNLMMEILYFLCKSRAWCFVPSQTCILAAYPCPYHHFVTKEGGCQPVVHTLKPSLSTRPSSFRALARGIGRAPNENTPTNTPRDRSERTGSTSRSPANGATSAVAPMSPFRRPIDVRRRPLLRRRNMQKGVKRGAAGSLTGSVSEPRGFVAPVLKCGSIHHNGAGELPI
jgi:hypothetical protein